MSGKSKYAWPHATMEVGEMAEFDLVDYGITNFREYVQHRLRNFQNHHDRAFTAEKIQCPPDKLMVRVRRVR